MLKAMTFASCLHGVWRVSGSLLGVCECLANAVVIEVLNQAQTIMAPFVCNIFPKASSQDFLRGLKGCLAVSGSVWRVSLECVVKVLVKSTLRNAIPTTKRPVYKSTVFSPSAPCQHFQRVTEGCLQGVWSMSGECLGVCSG